MMIKKFRVVPRIGRRPIIQIIPKKMASDGWSCILNSNAYKKDKA